LRCREELRRGRAIELIGLDELADDALVVSLGGIDAPVVGIEKIEQGEECLLALRALEREIGRPIDALVSVEIGGANSMEPMLERHDAYHLGWDDRSIDEVRFVVTSEETTVKALAASGGLSMSAESQALETCDAIGRMDGYEIFSFPTATNFYFKLNHQVPPTDDVNIRKAIAAATDYETIREALLPGEPLAGPMAATFADAHLDTLEMPVFDLEAAKALVDASAYADSTPIPVEIMYVAGLAFEEEIGLLMKSNLDQAGFETSLKPEPWNRLTELASDQGTTPAINQIFY